MLDQLSVWRGPCRSRLMVMRRSCRGCRPIELDVLERRLLLCADGMHDDLFAEPLGTFAGIDVPASARGRRGGASSTAKPSGDLSSAIPVLHSLPSALAKLYLNFGGVYTPSWGGFKPGTTPAYDRNGDPTTFTSSELDSIREIWARVAEKYSPFKIDVTTEDPGNRAEGKTLQVVLGGDSSWIGPGIGGVAYVGGFYNSLPNTVFVFTENLASGDPKYSAEAAAHEAGHGFGLFHQGLWSNRLLSKEYNPGNALTAPIMGNSFRSARGLWWRGTTSNEFNDIQNDMAVIASKADGFGFRPDDHGNTYRLADAATVSGTSISGKGIIEKSNDADYFKFQTGSGTIQLQVDPAAQGPMLDLKVELHDANGKLLKTADTTSMGESLSMSVSAGTYYLAVASHGGYGDVGQYSFTGHVVDSGGGDTDENPNPPTPPDPPKPPSDQGWGPPKFRWRFLPPWRSAIPTLAASEDLLGRTGTDQSNAGTTTPASPNAVWIGRLLGRYHRLA